MPGVREVKAAAKNGQVKFLSRQQGRKLFDRIARRRLGMSGEEFLRRWDAGFWKDPDSDPDVMHVWMAMPFAR